MFNRLASPTFSSGSESTQAVVDVYSKGDDAVVNSVQWLPDEASDGSPLESQTVLRKEDMPMLVLKDANGNDSYGYDARLATPLPATERVTDGNPLLQNLFRDLTSAVKSGVTVSGGLKGVITATLGSTLSRITANGLPDAKNISKMVTSFVGGNANAYNINFKDKGGISGLLTSLTAAGSAIGLPKVFSTMAAAIPDKSVLMASAQKLMPSIMTGGNINLLSDLASTNIAKSLVAMSPGLISKTLSNYKLPTSGFSQKDMTNLFTNTTSAFTLMNPNWNKTKRSGNTILSGLIVAGSKDFIKLLEAKVMSQRKLIPASVLGVGPVMPYHNEDEKFMLLMKDYEAKPVSACLASQYPLIKTEPKMMVPTYDVNEFVAFA